MNRPILAALLLLPMAAAQAQPAGLNAVDYSFTGLTYLGNQFQVDTGKLGKTHAGSGAVRQYAALMDTSHVAVEAKLVVLLGKLGVHQPPTSLLAGAYASLVRMLSAESGAAFDRDYVASQVDYQKANDALYRWELQNGGNARLKAFATEVLPKIDDHLQKAEALASQIGGR